MPQPWFSGREFRSEAAIGAPAVGIYTKGRIRCWPSQSAQQHHTSPILFGMVGPHQQIGRGSSLPSSDGIAAADATLRTHFGATRCGVCVQVALDLYYLSRAIPTGDRLTAIAVYGHRRLTAPTDHVCPTIVPPSRASRARKPNDSSFRPLSASASVFDCILFSFLWLSKAATVTLAKTKEKTPIVAA